MRSRRTLLRLARTGDAQAQYELGCNYDTRRPTDTRRAVYWYRQAAEQGHPLAQNNLAECLRDGEGIRKSRNEAFKWFLLAAQQGHSAAGVCRVCIILRRRCSEEPSRGSQVVSQGSEKRTRLRRNSTSARCIAMVTSSSRITGSPSLGLRNCQGQQPRCLYWLAQIYDGEGRVFSDGRLAVHWLRKAAGLGDAESRTQLGVHYIHGNGVARDPEQGAHWYREAAIQGEEWASICGPVLSRWPRRATQRTRFTALVPERSSKGVKEAEPHPLATQRDVSLTTTIARKGRHHGAGDLRSAGGAVRRPAATTGSL